MDYCKHSTFHAEKFKEKALFLFDLVRGEIGALKTPIMPPFIFIMMKAVLTNKDAHEITDSFIQETHNNWDDIKSRNEDQLIDTLPKAFISKDNLPIVIKTQIENFVTFLHNRKGVVSDTFDEEAWDIIDDMVKHSISYVHHRRVPDPKYTKEYHPSISVKKNAELWEVKI